MSTTTSPVTQMAEVAVNNAVTNDVASPVSEEIGSISTPVPSRMAAANPTRTIDAGFRGRGMDGIFSAEMDF